MSSLYGIAPNPHQAWVRESLFKRLTTYKIRKTSRGGIRTLKPLRARDFKSLVYTIPPLGLFLTSTNSQVSQLRRWGMLPRHQKIGIALTQEIEQVIVFLTV